MRPRRQLTQSQPMLAEDTGQRAWNGQPEAGCIRTSVLVGARGFEPVVPTCRIVVPDWIAEAVAGAGPQGGSRAG